MKYVITSKWVALGPQYTARFRDWNTRPKIKSDEFEISLPNGARKVDFIPVNAAGQIIIAEEAK